jgi:hypothetical protein
LIGVVIATGMEERLFDAFSPDFGEPKATAFANADDLGTCLQQALDQMETKRVRRLQACVERGLLKPRLERVCEKFEFSLTEVGPPLACLMCGGKTN